MLSDIHGNQYALKAVSEELRKSGIENIFILGDLVGYYYGVQSVLNMLSNFENTVYIKGNHDQMLLDLLDGKIDEGSIVSKYGSSHILAVESLKKSEKDFFNNLKDSHLVTLEGTSFSLNHGSPMDKNQYLYPDTDRTILEQCDQEVDFVLVGHSHYSFAFRNKMSMLVNVGSVGQSREKGGIASWCIIDTHSGSFQMKYTPYDTGALLKEIKEKDPQIPYLQNVLLR